MTQANKDIVPEFTVISEKIQETGDIVTLRFAPLKNPFKFLPGQFNMLYAFGTGEVPISISSDPTSGELLHTIRSLGSVTRQLANYEEGDQVGIRGPYGSQWPLPEEGRKDVIIVAGGLGLAPLRPLIYTLMNQPKLFRRFYLLYGTRNPDQILFKNELAAWNRDITEVIVTVDTADRSWQGHVGVVTKLFDFIDIDRGNTVAYLCGPEVMMRFCVQSLFNLGVGADNIYVSMERNMKCALAFCGHCQYGPYFVCQDGPVFNLSQIDLWFNKREI